MAGGETRSTGKKPKAEKPAKTPARSPSTPPAAVATTKNSDVPPGERHRMIAEAAYHRAERRGFTNGDPMQDWLEAEAEIEAQLRNGKPSSSA